MAYVSQGYGPKYLPKVEVLSLNGAGAVHNATGDYSGGAVYFELRPGATEVVRAMRMLVHIEDDLGFKASGYGGDATALVNGIDIQLVRGTGAGATLVSPITNAVNIKSNSDWGMYCYDTAYLDFGTGSTNKSLNVRFTFAKFVPDGIYLDGARDEAIRIVLNDPFDHLVNHHFVIEGHFANKTT